MSELKWNWVYYPYLDAPNKQEESALKAGYIKVVIKSEADKVIAEKDKEIAEKDAEILRMIEDWNRLCEKYNKFIKLKQEFCEKFKDIELEITK